MNKIPLTIEKSVLVDQDGINFLDALLILLENIKLLIVFPMILGLCALSATYVWPKTFESLAIIKADSSILSLITTSSVIDPVAIKLGLIENESQEEARRKLRSQIKVNLGRADQMLTLTVSASTPNQAQANCQIKSLRHWLAGRSAGLTLINLSTAAIPQPRPTPHRQASAHHQLIPVPAPPSH